MTVTAWPVGVWAVHRGEVSGGVVSAVHPARGGDDDVEAAAGLAVVSCSAESRSSC
ncbi:hypothetical protein [Micromonospora sp. NPDC005413]|uniref:hypothetical protein n=1 Tax=Micromonospora sp. NPDC005413 TaxID=3154563 RepID=UPI0033A797FB